MALDVRIDLSAALPMTMHSLADEEEQALDAAIRASTRDALEALKGCVVPARATPCGRD